ncbi:type II toxin-antitoxin system RelE/ParE family toxin [Pontibacter diazotrophicus]|uniref:Type II toxin-antitoxin system RelE/ParE family toxin n=1 Tax=Pontibacter diazotrophicus TaxID=1400979 RepID=A0A3D8L875_9BACT|nr:type II toxin-antitoxin system RelE/ParE family toxin [Pontibacter diazotrophicus]RDV13182.1 type II toxin-antitoxin system RelE/ParE family toxin [Pontibacter diazotrophicus]
MKLKVTKGFRDKLNAQIEYIAKDKPAAARKFKNDLILKIKEIPGMPFKNRKSVFFDRDDIRDLVFRGYITVYKVDLKSQEVQVFGFTKYEQDPFKE